MKKSESRRTGGQLAAYKARRDFKKTKEPSGKVRKRVPPGSNYVIQKHRARRLHYDFRLELNGVMKSWAVPRGPSLNPEEKRLAVQVEDHPLEYRKFEGSIAEGQYGAGEVIVWDRGAWEPLDDANRALEKGALHFILKGEKLKGEWILVQLRNSVEGKNWLLIKARDRFSKNAGARDITEAKPESVKSGKTIEEIAQKGTGKRGRKKERPDS